MTDAITCATCEASCCRLQVLLIGDNDIPARMVDWTEWGGQTMRREEDGWCSALDRTTLLCTIYGQRPQICRDFETGSAECLDERQGAVPGPAPVPS